MKNITIPIFVFSSLISFFFGSLIHLIFGGKPIRLFFSIIFSWIGFWVGNNLGVKYGVEFLKYGPIVYGISVFSSILLGLGGYWISGENNSSS
jgi:hypothetical protein